MFNAFSAWLEKEDEILWQDIVLIVISTIAISITLFVVGGVGGVLVGHGLLHALNITKQVNNSVSGGGNIGNSIRLPTSVQTSATPVLNFAIPPAEPIATPPTPTQISSYRAQDHITECNGEGK